MKTVSRAAISVAIIFSAGLAGCGGTQGVGSTPAAYPTPSPTPAAGSNAAARATMQSSLTTLEITSSNASPIQLLATRRAIKNLHVRQPKDGAECDSGVEGSTTTDPVTQLPISTTTYFYDQACTEPEFTEVLHLTTDTVTDTSETVVANGTATYYSMTGAVTQYDPLALNLSVNDTTETIIINLTESEEATINGTPYGTFGTTCTLSETADTITCGAAGVYNSNGAQSGVSLSENYTVTGNSAPTSTITASAYTAASGLAIAPGTSPAWTVTGASPVDTVTGTLTIGALTGVGNTTGGTISLSDATTGVALTGTISTTGVTLTETLAGKQLAGATVNQYGNGTITYADGTSKAIVSWTIQG
jgi:hypothetical protein